MADNYDIIDAHAAQQTFKSTETASVHTPHHIIDKLPTEHVDAFDRIRISNPGYRFDSQFTYQIDSDLWSELSPNGSVTHDATERWALLSADGSVATNKVILQSAYHAPYTPGRSQFALLTFVMGAAPEDGGARRAGYWDGTNGVYLEQKTVGAATTVSLVLDSGTTVGAQTVLQEDWNVDPMDGTGPSGITLDLSKTQILAIPLQALYVGRAVVGFDIDGKFWPAHQFLHSNIKAQPYIQQASLPLRFEVEADSTAAPVTMAGICGSVLSEGGADLQDMPGRQFVATGSLTSTAAGALIVIRSKEQLNSINQNAVVIPTDVDVTVTGAPCWIEVRRNATVTAGTFTDIDSLSTVEASFAGNAGTDPVVTAGTGTLIDRFYVPAAATARVNKLSGITGKALLAYNHLLGSGDSLSVIWNGGTVSTDVHGSLKWKEIR